MINFEKIAEQANRIRRLLKRNQNKPIAPPSLLESYEELLRIVNSNNQLKNNFTIRDLSDFFSSFSFYYGKSLFTIPSKEFSKILKEYFYQEPKEFHYYFRVDFRYRSVKDGIVGSGKLIKFDALSNALKKKIEAGYPHEYVSDSSRSMSDEQYREYRKSDYYMLIKVKSIGRDNSKQLAIVEFKQNTAIFNFFTRNYFSEEQETSSFYISTDDKGKWASTHYGNIKSKTPISQFFHTSYIPQINKILVKANKGEIEKNILRVINISGQITNSSILEVRFLFTLVAIETLLTIESKDYLNWRMSERLAFLLADNKYWIAYYKKIPEQSSKFKKITSRYVQNHLGESRSQLFQTAKNLYGKRSSLAHLDNKKNIITEQDYVLARFLLFSLTVKLLELLDMGISSYIKKSNQVKDNSLVGYIDNLKFN